MPRCVRVPEILWLQFSSIVVILKTKGGALTLSSAGEPGYLRPALTLASFDFKPVDV